MVGYVCGLHANEGGRRMTTGQAAKPTARRWRLGPGLLVTAAFIGPGTVTTASLAGAKFGFALLWALLFAVVATIVLQEMAARIGLVARLGLAEAIRTSIRPAWARHIAIGLVLIAIVLGNTAYQTGNLMGAGIGLSLLTGLPVDAGVIVLGTVIALLLFFESTDNSLYRVLVAIVVFMSVAFLGAAVAVRPDPIEVARGVFGFALPSGSLLTVLALIGTTIVPYNLFLHATAVQRSWPADANVGASLRASRVDTILAIVIGGTVTMAIVASAAAVFRGGSPTPASVTNFARQLEPLLGPAGKFLFAMGLAAAGITSAVTAPLAAGYTVAGAFPSASPRVIKGTTIAVVVIGTLLAVAFGKSPQITIVVAQAANAVLLPLVAVFLLWVMNRRELLGEYCNGLLLNLAGGVVVLITCGLAAKSLVSLFW